MLQLIMALGIFSLCTKSQKGSQNGLYFVNFRSQKICVSGHISVARLMIQLVSSLFILSFLCQCAESDGPNFNFFRVAQDWNDELVSYIAYCIR